MSKHLKHILLPAEEKGWDLWQDSKEGLLYVKSVQALSKKSAGVKDACIALPVELIVTSPIVLPQAPSTTLMSMASLELEQSGLLKKDSSWDMYPIDSDDSLHAAVSLLEEGNTDISDQLGSLITNTFDFSARFFDVGDLDTVLCKKEHGRWSLIFYKNAQPFYAELLDDLESVSQSIKALLLEMEIREIPFSPHKMMIVKDASWMPYHDQEMEYLQREGLMEVQVIEKVKLVWHNQSDLKIVPSAVSVSRSKKQKAERLKLLLLVGVCLYAITGMFIYKQHRQRENQIQKARNEVDALQPQWERFQNDNSKLNDLDDVLTNQWALATFEKIYSHLPANQELRFQVIELQSDYIIVKGGAPNFELINTFRPLVANDPYFKGFQWNMPAVVKDSKTKIYRFTMEAFRKGGAK